MCGKRASEPTNAFGSMVSATHNARISPGQLCLLSPRPDRLDKPLWWDDDDDDGQGKGNKRDRSYME